MALSNNRLTIVADTVVDDVRIATYGAIMNLENLSMSLTARKLDEHACKVYRDVVRADQAAFEDFAYEVQEQVMAIKGTE
jgi:hypothetical protein